MEKEIICIVHGRVHGVGFRMFTQKLACELGLFGYVSNLPDGTVEVVAQGEEENLKKFLDQVKRGPIFSKIDKVEVTWHDRRRDSFAEFRIV